MWQDVSFFDGSAQLLVFQCHIAVRPAPDQLVMFTLTSDQNELDALPAKMRFTCSPAFSPG